MGLRYAYALPSTPSRSEHRCASCNSFEQYSIMYQKIYRALLQSEEFDEEDALETATDDWER